jgi:peptide/nickel transport system substrate-binding protein
MGRQVTELLFDHLAEVGDSLNVIGDGGFQPRLAQRWEWSHDSLSIAFYLNPKARWHDGQQVTARDVQFTYQLYTAPALASPTAPLLANIDSVTVRDSLTPVFWFKHRSPGEFFDAVGQMLILPQHVYGSVPPDQLAASPIIRKPIGSGRFRFVRWEPGSTIEIASDTGNYRGRANFDRVIWTIAPDFNAATTKLLRGDADFFEAMRPETIQEAAKTPTVRVVMYPGFDYGFMMFNLRAPKDTTPHPIFSDVNVRRALTMAIDRRGIVKNVLDTLAYVSRGPMLRAMPTTDTSIAQIPYDTLAAARLLDSLGWHMQKDGVRVKNGHRMVFTILTPSSSQSRIQCAVLLQAQFKKIGAEVKIQQLEPNAFVRAESSHDFDAVMQTWHMDANPASIVQIWGSVAAHDSAGTNYGGYSDPKFDRQMDSALAATQLSDAQPLFKQAYQTIVNDAPAIWLYELKGAVGVNHRIHITTIRPDAWWIHLASWSIPAADRIARDRIPPVSH